MPGKPLLFLGVILLFLGGIAMAGCNKKEKEEQPPSTEDMIKYVKYSWKVAATADDIRQVLFFDNPQTLIPFKSEIGGILTINSMKKDVDRGEYGKAAKRGVGWLLPFGLKEIGFRWLSSYISLAKAVYEFFEWLFEDVNETAFNAQVQYYLWYREDGVPEEEMKERYAVRNGYLQNPRRGYFSIQPSPVSKFTPEDVFRVGRAFWEAKQAEQYRSQDETAIKESFIATLKRLHFPVATATSISSPTPHPTATATPPPTPSPKPTATARATATIRATPTPTSPSLKKEVIYGKYINQDDSSEYLELDKDGTFYLREMGIGFTGNWKIKGDEIILMFSLGIAAKGKIEGDTIIDEDGKTWKKEKEFKAKGGGTLHHLVKITY